MYKETFGRMMGRKRPGIVALALFLLMIATACSKNANNVNSGNASGGNSSATFSSNKTSSSSTPAAGISPTAVFKAYYDTAEKRDFATAKQYLSQSTLSLMEENAKKQGKTVEESMKDSPATKPGDMPQLSNEQINGDTATIDLTSEGQTMKMPFVKEGGEWKIALDKFLEEIMKGMQGPPSTGEEKEGAGHDNANH